MGNNLVTDEGNVNVYFTKYKSYVALMSQGQGDSLVGVPEVIICNGQDSNFLSGVVFSYQAAGKYRATLVGGLPYGKTWFNVSENEGATVKMYAYQPPDQNDYIDFYSETYAEQSPSDGQYINTPIEIRVYPL